MFVDNDDVVSGNGDCVVVMMLLVEVMAIYSCNVTVGRCYGDCKMVILMLVEVTAIV